MGRQRFDRPYGTEKEQKYTLLPSDKSLGYCQATLRVEMFAVSEATWVRTRPDMSDRIIAATAVHLGVPLITCDAKLRRAELKTI